jgi:hypothetical protein
MTQQNQQQITKYQRALYLYSIAYFVVKVKYSLPAQAGEIGIVYTELVEVSLNSDIK